MLSICRQNADLDVIRVDNDGAITVGYDVECSIRRQVSCASEASTSKEDPGVGYLARVEYIECVTNEGASYA